VVHDESLTDVHLDPGRYKQMLYNYLSNAFKFSPDEGRVLIQHTQPTCPACSAWTCATTAWASRSAIIARLFTEFEQLEAGASKRHQGTGLGLALTKRLVEAQGGRVGVSSIVGQGSEFFAVLPRRPGVADHGRRTRKGRPVMTGETDPRGGRPPSQPGPDVAPAGACTATRWSPPPTPARPWWPGCPRRHRAWC
jgi:hypothetical protein